MKQHDEYIWQNYTKEYSAQLQDVKNINRHDFFISAIQTDAFNKEIISFGDNLHPNWCEIYAAAYRLKPKSILEIGCGGCYHLHNLDLLLPDAEIHGVDLLQSQLDFGKQFSELPEEIANNLRVMDFTKERPDRQYEFVFTQAVVMHLSTDNAVKFMNNMKAVSSKYLFLMEGVANHENWYDFVKSIFTEDEWTFERPNKYIDNGILLTKKV